MVKSTEFREAPWLSGGNDLSEQVDNAAVNAPPPPFTANPKQQIKRTGALVVNRDGVVGKPGHGRRGGVTLGQVARRRRAGVAAALATSGQRDRELHPAVGRAQVGGAGQGQHGNKKTRVTHRRHRRARCT